MDKLVALILCKDFLSLLKNTLQNLVHNEIKEVIICNCYTGKESHYLKILVKHFVKFNHIKIKVFDHKFKNYSEARNALFDYADEITTKDKVYLITDTWDLLKIIDKEEFEKCILSEWNIKCIIKQDSFGMTWYYPKLVESHNKNIRFVRYAYEYIDNFFFNKPEKDCVIQYRSKISILNKEYLSKCNQVISLLEQELSELIGSNYSRTLFYLGQEYYCIYEYEKAYSFYKKRVEFDECFEEKFEAYKRLLELSCHLKKDVELIHHYFKEACKLQKRAEVYTQYIRYLVLIKSSDKELDYIHELCEECLALQPPKNTILFFNENSYKKERIELYLSIFPPKFEKPKECEVCYNNPEVSLLKCKHWCCEKCIENLNVRRCPFCRQAI